MGKEKTLKEMLLKMIAKKDVREKICEMLINEDAGGNFKAVDLIRDMTGEKNASDVDLAEQVTHIKIEVVDAKGTQD